MLRWIPIPLGLLLTAAQAAAIPTSTPFAGDHVVTIRDLVELKTLDSLALSPDKRHLAFRIIDRDLDGNRTEVRWMSMDLTSMDHPPSLLGRSSEPIWMPIYDVLPEGARVWSPDGRGLFVLQQDPGGVQVHRLGPNGQDERISRDPGDLRSFELTSDGKALRYSAGTSRIELAGRQNERARHGIDVDGSLISEGMRLTDNFVAGGRVTTIERLNMAMAGEVGEGAPVTREVAIRTGSDGKTATGPNRQIPTGAGTIASSDFKPDAKLRLRNGTTLGLEGTGKDDPLLGIKSYQLVATLPDGSRRPCPAVFCRGLSSALRQVTFSDATGEAIVLYEKDWSSRTAIFAWDPASGATRTVLDPGGALDGGLSYAASPCVKAGERLLCVFASANVPARLVQIDLVTGVLATLYDPNPSFASKHLPATRFMEWRDALGRPANGILVLPRDVKGPLPLTITTSRCRGLLRGGSGLLAPEFLLAQDGIAALCFNNDNSARDVDRLGHEVPLAMQQAALDAIEAILTKLEDDRLVDPSRIAITGHSYGAILATYAISHTNLFAAAVIGTGTTLDPLAYYVTAPTSDSPRRAAFAAMGLPPPTNDPMAVWQKISPALNADRIHAPLLIQAPESEWLFGLQLLASVQDAGGTARMVAYPREGHMSNREPIHEYWRIRRSLDWIEKYLGVGSPNSPGSGLAGVQQAPQHPVQTSTSSNAISRP
jgi:dienelactone hydrolase